MTPHLDRHPRALRALERRVHAAALRALDLTPEDLDGVLERMFRRRRRDPVSYWLQLLLSRAGTRG